MTWLPCGVIELVNHERIEARVTRFDTGDERIDDFHRREVALADEQSHLGRAHIGELVGESHVFLPAPARRGSTRDATIEREGE